MKPCKLFFLFFLVSLCLFSGCKKQKDAKKIEKTPQWFAQYTFFDIDEYYDFLQDQINSLSDRELIFSEQVKAYYDEQDEPIWTINGFQEHHIDTMVTVLSRSWEHGLSPRIFGYEQIQKNIHDIRSMEFNNADDLYAALAQLEVQLTNAYILYSNSLVFGATDPLMVNGNKWLCNREVPTAEFVTHSLMASDTAMAYLEQIQPHDSNYLALQKELKGFLLLKDTVFTPIPYLEGRAGQRVAHAHLIGERLKVLGLMKPSYTPSDTLSRTLMRALNRFRENRAIPVSHSLDVETIDALNWQPKDYIDKLSANMERYRWKVTPQKESAFIAVNIADFSMIAYCADTIAIRTRVCCGKSPAREKSLDSCLVDGLLPAQKSETPLLYSEVNCVVLNPEWNIPYSILKDEYYPKLVKNNVKVIQKEKLHVMVGKTKQEVLPETINWKKISPKNIPYRLVQSSGTHNALGLLKFNFPNTESVYLHDTNLKSAFKRRVRALSHGCVRVENPMDLATLLLRMNEYTDEEMEEVMIILGNEPTTEEGELYLEKRLEKEQKYFEKLAPEDTVFYRPLRPTNLYLKKKMPVYFEYHTCFLGENGDVQYRPDIYSKEYNGLTCLKRLEK